MSIFKSDDLVTYRMAHWRTRNFAGRCGIAKIDEQVSLAPWPAERELWLLTIVEDFPKLDQQQNKLKYPDRLRCLDTELSGPYESVEQARRVLAMEEL